LVDMGALKEIGTALRTTIGENVRASIDPAFARAQTEQRNREKTLLQQEEISTRAAQTKRAHEQKGADHQFKLKTQLFATTMAAQEGLATGNWEGVAKMAQTPELDENIRASMKMIVDAGLPQGFEFALKQGELLLKARNSSAKDLANQLKDKKLQQDERFHIRRMFLEKSKFNFERAESDRDRMVESGDVEVVKEFFRTSPMVDEKERAGWMKAVEGKVGAKQAVNVMNKFLDKEKAEFNLQMKAQIKSKNPNTFPAFKFFNDDYQQQSKPMRTGIQTINEIENLLAQPQTGATNKALTASVTSLFSTNVRALQELEQWKHLGDIGQRVGSHVLGFLQGTRPESTQQDISNLVADYKKDLIRADKIARANTWDQATGFSVDPFMLFPDNATERFKNIRHTDGKLYRADTWRETFELIPE